MKSLRIASYLFAAVALILVILKGAEIISGIWYLIPMVIGIVLIIISESIKLRKNNSKEQETKINNNSNPNKK